MDAKLTTAAKLRAYAMRFAIAACVAMGPSMATAQEVTYYHTDALGSVVAVTNASGQVVERNEYEPYGEDLQGAKDGPAYIGHVYDVATGMNYMQQRYYDPEIGRFLSVDPVAADGNSGANFNRFAYAANNPYRFIDPDGRQSRDNSSLTAHSSNIGVRVVFSGYMIRSAVDKAADHQSSPGVVESRLNKFVNPEEIADAVDSTEGRDPFQSGRNLERSDRRYAYTREDGFIDLAHASTAYRSSVTPGAGQLLGDFGNEFLGDFLIKGSSSAFMPEDHAGHVMSTHARWLNLFHFGRLTAGQALQLAIMERGALTKEQVVGKLGK